jgi:hypothetical protein
VGGSVYCFTSELPEELQKVGGSAYCFTSPAKIVLSGDDIAIAGKVLQKGLYMFDAKPCGLLE